MGLKLTWSANGLRFFSSFTVSPESTAFSVALLGGHGRIYMYVRKLQVAYKPVDLTSIQPSDGLSRIQPHPSALARGYAAPFKESVRSNSIPFASNSQLAWLDDKADHLFSMALLMLCHARMPTFAILRSLLMVEINGDGGNHRGQPACRPIKVGVDGVPGLGERKETTEDVTRDTTIMPRKRRSYCRDKRQERKRRKKLLAVFSLFYFSLASNAAAKPGLEIIARPRGVQ